MASKIETEEDLVAISGAFAAEMALKRGEKTLQIEPAIISKSGIVFITKARRGEWAPGQPHPGFLKVNTDGWLPKTHDLDFEEWCRQNEIVKDAPPRNKFQEWFNSAFNNQAISAAVDGKKTEVVVLEFELSAIGGEYLYGLEKVEFEIKEDAEAHLRLLETTFVSFDIINTKIYNEARIK